MEKELSEYTHQICDIQEKAENIDKLCNIDFDQLQEQSISTFNENIDQFIAKVINNRNTLN